MKGAFEQTGNWRGGWSQDNQIDQVTGMKNNSQLSSTTTVDEVERDGLLYMREEEKLARDVYLTLSEQWELPIFSQIATSEQRHTDSIANLLEKYEIEDPVINDERGVFVDPNLQDLYHNLVVQGSESLIEALKVGILIEETDIIDIQGHIEHTDNPDIQQVYGNLLDGSANHLEAFTSTLNNFL
jgi:hypothetical protein